MNKEKREWLTVKSVRKIWYHKGLLQKQMEHSEITIYEGTSPGIKKSPQTSSRVSLL